MFYELKQVSIHEEYDPFKILVEDIQLQDTIHNSLVQEKKDERLFNSKNPNHDIKGHFLNTPRSYNQFKDEKQAHNHPHSHQDRKDVVDNVHWSWREAERKNGKGNGKGSGKENGKDFKKRQIKDPNANIKPIQYPAIYLTTSMGEDENDEKIEKDDGRNIPKKSQYSGIDNDSDNGVNRNTITEITTTTTTVQLSNYVSNEEAERAFDDIMSK